MARPLAKGEKPLDWKSPSGIRTARTDIDLIARRLKIAQQDYEARHGKTHR